MKRSLFAISGVAALAGTALPRRSLAGTLHEGMAITQADLFAALPRPKPREWTRVILGSGVQYQKQIGAGIETAGASRLLYYELQVGSPGGSCNPSTMRKAYLRTPEFGSLFQTYPLVSNIGRTENMVYRYGDITGGTTHEKADTTLRLLDEDYLYDPRPARVVSVSTERIHVSSQDVDTTHVVTEYAPSNERRKHLERVELWHSPLFPFGVARYRAHVTDLDPFDLHVFSHGDNFSSLLSLSLEQVRAITKDGTYGQLPESVGA